MNWKAVGVTLLVLSLIGGGIGLSAGKWFEASKQQRAEWAIGCFNGAGGCGENRANEILVRQWTDYGIYLAIGSCVLGMLGAGLFIGSTSAQVSPSTVVLSDTEEELTPDQQSAVEAIERELALRGIRID